MDNHIFENRATVQKVDSGKLYLGFTNLGYFKNNEYSNDIADGLTLFGYQFNPYFSYHPSAAVSLSAGVYLQQEFGASDFTEIAPTLTLKIKTNEVSFLFGTLEGNLHHKLIEPLYDFENTLSDPLENGVQLIWQRERLFLDTWLDWRNAIFKGDDQQEELVFGTSINYNFLTWGDVNIFIPVQLIVFHRGGQIDASPLPVLTLVNGAVGLEIEGPVSPTGFWRRWYTKNYFTLYNDASNTKRQPFDQGNGWYLNIGAKTRIFEIMGSFWHGDGFIAPIGGQLYPSVSSTFKNPDAIEEIRALFILRLLYDWPVTDQLVMGARLEPYYDFKNREVEFSSGLYIHYRPKFYLGKPKTPRP